MRVSRTTLLVLVSPYVNFLFLVLLVRRGLQILTDHPRLYWNVHCTPRTHPQTLLAYEMNY